MARPGESGKQVRLETIPFIGSGCGEGGGSVPCVPPGGRSRAASDLTNYGPADLLSRISSLELESFSVDEFSRI
jgi:hypothetical protein